MIARPTQPGAEEGWRVIDTAARCAHDRLGDALLSAYAIGSLAHGGFRAAVSDVDLALLTDDQPGRDISQTVEAITTQVRDEGQRLGGNRARSVPTPSNPRCAA
jgi:UTP:GlnB (protein PII) uridylyltransferase